MIIKLVGTQINPVTLVKTIRCDENITLGKPIDLKTAKRLADNLLQFHESVFEPTVEHMQSLSEIEIHDYCEVPNQYRVKVTN